MNITIDPVKLAEIISALAIIGGAAFGLVKWVLRQAKQDKDIDGIKQEQTLICYAIKACLDGLEQLGANHTVPVAKEKLEKYLNQKAHEQVSGKDNNNV